MKNLYKLFIVLCSISLLNFTVIEKWDHEKSKSIKKSYKVNSNAKVAIDNKYGNINITTWDKNRVEIEVKVTVKGNDLDDVNDKLEEIDVNFYNSSNLVEAKTNIGSKKSYNWSWWKKSKNLSFKINYTIKMPKSNSIDLDNNYGNIYLDKLNGKATIHCGYGKIAIGELFNESNNVSLDYCSTSTISYINSGNIDADYSKIEIDDAEKLDVNADYSGVRIERVKSLDFNSDYGSIVVDDVINVSGNSDYAGMRFGIVRKNLKIDTEYGGLRIKKLAKNFNKVTIDGQYAGIKIGLDDDTSFNFDIDLQYAGFGFDDSKATIYRRNVKSTKKYYRGVYGKNKNTQALLTIKSQYGGVRLKENY